MVMAIKSLVLSNFKNRLEKMVGLAQEEIDKIQVLNPRVKTKIKLVQLPVVQKILKKIFNLAQATISHQKMPKILFLLYQTVNQPTKSQNLKRTSSPNSCPS